MSLQVADHDTRPKSWSFIQLKNVTEHASRHTGVAVCLLDATPLNAFSTSSQIIATQGAHRVR